MITREELEKLKRPELSDYCRKHGIPGYAGKKKEDKIKLILDFYSKPKFERPIRKEKTEMTKKQIVKKAKKDIKEGTQKVLWDREKVYADELKLMGKFFIVEEPWKIGGCLMKKGDVLKAVDYGSGGASHYVEFLNKRLQKHKFRTGTWLFEKNTKPKDSESIKENEPTN